MIYGNTIGGVESKRSLLQFEGATVGQLIKIAEVTDNGVPSVLEPTDFPIDHTLAETGKAADSKIVGDKLRELENKANSFRIILNGLTTDKQTWDYISRLVDSGNFGKIYTVGDQFVEEWTDVAASKAYEYPFQLNHIGDVELEDGTILNNRPFFQAHYAHPFGVQFSHQRAFLFCPDGLSAGTYYFTIDTKWGSNISAGDVICFTLTKNVPSGGKIAGCYGAPDTKKSNWRIYSYAADGKTMLETVVPTFDANGINLGVQKHNARNGNLNSTQEMAYGYNRWKTSSLRQYLNSDAGVGEWWTPQDNWDIAPDELKTKAGYLSGFSSDFKNALKKVKVTTYANTTVDGGVVDITYDKIFIPSLEQMYINPQIRGEGEFHEYWKQRSGLNTPMNQYGTYSNIITYAVENHSAAQSVRLRSAYRGGSCIAWYVYASCDVSYNGASHAFRFSPLGVV